MELVVSAWFVIVGLLLLLMALASTLLERLPLTTSMLYLLVGVALGPLGVGLIAVDPLRHAAALERLTEGAVVVSLFATGMKLRVPLADLRWRAPVRLATLTMLVGVALAATLAHLLLGLPLGAAILLGAVLAPTDPVLASDVQVEHAADRSRLRFSLTGEAGLNDGTAFPLVMLGLGLLGHHELGSLGERWLALDVLWAGAGGLALGALLGTLVGRLTVHLRRKEHAVGNDDFIALGLIALAYGGALLLHAYGFLAVFASAVALRRVERRLTGDDRKPHEALLEASPGAESVASQKDAKRELATHPEAAPAHLAETIQGFTEAAERILELGVVLVLGGLLAYAHLDARSVAFAAAMLLLVRPLSVFLTYGGLGASRSLRPYVAWFGIRGIGSLYYLFYASTHGLAGPHAARLLGVTLATVATSVVVHGVSVTPIMARYAARREARLARIAKG